MSTVAEPLLMTVFQAADRLQVHPMTLRAKLWAGELECVRIGRAVRIPVAALAAYVEGLPTDGRRPQAARKARG